MADLEVPPPSSATATALLSIHFARRALRARVTTAIVAGNSQAMAAFYLQRDALGRMAMDLMSSARRPS